MITLCVEYSLLRNPFVILYCIVLYCNIGKSLKWWKIFNKKEVWKKDRVRFVCSLQKLNKLVYNGGIEYNRIKALINKVFMQY